MRDLPGEFDSFDLGLDFLVQLLLILVLVTRAAPGALGCEASLLGLSTVSGPIFAAAKRIDQPKRKKTKRKSNKMFGMNSLLEAPVTDGDLGGLGDAVVDVLLEQLAVLGLLLIHGFGRLRGRFGFPCTSKNNRQETTQEGLGRECNENLTNEGKREKERGFFSFDFKKKGRCGMARRRRLAPFVRVTSSC